MAQPDFFSTPIEYLKGVGPQRADLLKKEAGIFYRFSIPLFHLKMRKYFFTLSLLLAIAIVAKAQNRNSVWCFGDSAGIIFNGTSTSLFTSEIKGRGSCVSISDSLGQLLFYAYTRANTPGNTTLVYNRDHTLMPNGGNVVGEAWYQELVIVPDPGNTNLYYLFCVGETGGGGAQGYIIRL